MMGRRELELMLLLLLASASGILALLLDRWLFVGIFGAEVAWVGFIMALLLEPD
jgi:hypothetical protein